MKPKVFLISDTHFGHTKMYEQPFLKEDGTRLRPWSNAAEADQEMIRRWNAVVRPCDKVYHLGDVAMPRSGLQVLKQLNGDKILIAGNHDSKYMKELLLYFRAIRGYWKLNNFILSHVPVHPNSLRNFEGNIHGHLHAYETLLEDGSVDTRYISACVEHTDYAPIEFNELVARFRKRANQ